MGCWAYAVGVRGFRSGGSLTGSRSRGIYKDSMRCEGMISSGFCRACVSFSKYVSDRELLDGMIWASSSLLLLGLCRGLLARALG